MPTLPLTDRITCSVTEACAATGLGRSTIYELMARGAIDSLSVGRRRLVRVESILRLLAPREEA